MYDIVAIGSATRDNFLELDYQLVDWPKTPSGKAIVLPLGEKLSVQRVFCTIGGNAVNASVTFARQDFRTACFGKIGNDIGGRDLQERLKKEGVKTLFAVSNKQPTAYSTLLLKDSERTILGYHGASDAMILSDIPWNQLKSRWWYLSLAGESDKLLEPLLKFAKKNKILVAFNPSGHHIKHYPKRILACLKYLTFLVLNEGEAAELVGIPFKKEKAVFKKLDKLTPGIVAVTSGPKGVTVSDGKYLYKAGIFKEQRHADRTGAGDAFGSGFTAGLMRMQRSAFSVQRKGGNKNTLNANRFTLDAIKYAIRLATANAASVVEHIGASEGTLTKQEFEKSPRWRKLPIQVKSL